MPWEPVSLSRGFRGRPEGRPHPRIPRSRLPLPASAQLVVKQRPEASQTSLAVAMAIAARVYKPVIVDQNTGEPP